MLIKIMLVMTSIILVAFGNIKLLILLGLGFLIYKTGIHEKVLSGVNKFTNNTAEHQKNQKEKKRFMRKFLRHRRINEEI